MTRNRGAAGVDDVPVCRSEAPKRRHGGPDLRRDAAAGGGVSIEAIEDQGVETFLAELQEALAAGSYRPLLVRRVTIPKRNGGERPLGVPAIRDRVAQAATKLVIEPIFDADFSDCADGFRPKRSVLQAREHIRRELHRGRRYVVDADVKGFFDAIRWVDLLVLVRKRVSNRRVLKLLTGWLRAGMLTKEGLLHPEAETPPPKPFSGRDGLAMARKRVPEQPRSDMAGIWAQIWRGRPFAACWPSRSAIAAARDRIRQLTPLTKIRCPVIVVVQDIDRFLRGWGAYFRYGNSTQQFRRLDDYVFERVAHFIACKHKSRTWRRGIVDLIDSRTKLGIHRLAGTVRYASAQAAR